MRDIDRLAIKNIRVLAMETITKAESGHPGIALGAAPIMYTLYTKVLKKNPMDPTWYNRDRFILAAGHGSSLLYTMLHLTGYNVTIDDLKSFRQLGSKTPGHPELGVTCGVDATSGPLGQGIPFGVGTAISEEYMRNKYNNDINLFDHYTYVLCGDGDLQEGVTNEALSLCSVLKPNRLIILYDSNDIQLDGQVSLCNKEDVKKKVEACGFNYMKVNDGEDIDDIYNAIMKAKKSNMPSFIEVKTIIGKTSKNENTNAVHGAPLKKDEVIDMRDNLGGEEFSVLDEVKNLFNEIKSNDLKAYDEDYKNLSNYKAKYPKLYSEIFDKKTITKDDLDLPFDASYNKATRNAGGDVMNRISEIDKNLIGGSADLMSSTYIKGINGEFSSTNRLGRNIRFGVREFAMGVIANAISVYGYTRGFLSGFFVFSDYLKPALRMQAIMHSPVINCFTHDSIAVGEDGPTHQPIEQLTMLRSIPNMNVIRPCGREEVKEAFVIAYNSLNNPTSIILSRQAMNEYRTLDNAKENLSMYGAYVIKKEVNKLDCILLATGSEVDLACKAKDALFNEGIDVRVVSMPSMYLFDKQSKEYQDEVLPKDKFILGIEMSEACHMYKYINGGKLLNITTFGESGKASDVMNHFGFTVENVCRIVKENM